MHSEKEPLSLVMERHGIEWENNNLRGITANYERVKRAFGPEEVESAVEVMRQREKTDREQKRNADKKFSRGVR